MPGTGVRDELRRRNGFPYGGVLPRAADGKITFAATMITPIPDVIVRTM
ncbi:hypothetical protein [Streptomyces rimosus]